MAVNLKFLTGVNSGRERGDVPGKSLCFLCGAIINTDEAPLCTACSNDLPLNKLACPGCAIPVESDTLCAQCLRMPESLIANVVGVFRYEYPVTTLIHHMKFNSRLDIAAFFGKAIAEKILKQGIKFPQAIIPVPLHSSRLAERGYNQSLELARAASKKTGVPVDYRACHRIHKTAAQTGLSAPERKKNIRGVFGGATGAILCDYYHVAIIDDVMTTGSTAHELAGALSRAGVKYIDVWACARASL